MSDINIDALISAELLESASSPPRSSGCQRTSDDEQPFVHGGKLLLDTSDSACTMYPPSSSATKRKKKRSSRHTKGKSRIKIPLSRTWESVNRRIVPPSLDQRVWPTYRSFLQEICGSTLTLPPEQAARTPLPVFPGRYRSPQEVPKRIQEGLSSYRFFFANNLFYRWELGHAFYIVSQCAYAKGLVFNIFPEKADSTRELFYRDTSTGAIYYLGEFQLVRSAPFLYNSRVVGDVPGIKRAPIVPSKGNINVPYVFVVLQFVNWNSTLYKAFSETTAAAPVV